jgi:hypothetical protein
VLLMSLQISRGWQPILSGRVTAVEAGDVSQCAMPE